VQRGKDIEENQTKQREEADPRSDNMNNMYERKWKLESESAGHAVFVHVVKQKRRQEVERREEHGKMMMPMRVRGKGVCRLVDG